MHPEPDVSELAFRALVRVTGLFRNRMEPYFTRFGISGAQWGILRTLYRAESEHLESLRLTDLGQRVIVRPPSVTAIVDRLERLGLVTRRVTPTDQRSKQVALTVVGRQLVERVLEQHPAQMRAVLAGLAPAEQGDLQRLLERLAAHLASANFDESVLPAARPQHVEGMTP
jgi:DNA-binding MarR family transcriptional regulator